MTKKATFELPITSVDVVVFSLIDNTLKVLLVQRKRVEQEPFPECWALVGGFIDVDNDADLEATAYRKLKEKTNVSAAYLEQLGSWGNKTRDPRGWSTTHAYFSMLKTGDVQSPEAGANASAAQWFDVLGEGVSCKLAFDHAILLREAILRLRSKVEYTSLPAFLMPKLFTLNQLRQAYEAILERDLDKSAFRKRILSTDLLSETDQYQEASNRPALLYTLTSTKDPVMFQRTFNPAK